MNQVRLSCKLNSIAVCMWVTHIVVAVAATRNITRSQHSSPSWEGKLVKHRTATSDFLCRPLTIFYLCIYLFFFFLFYLYFVLTVIFCFYTFSIFIKSYKSIWNYFYVLKIISHWYWEEISGSSYSIINHKYVYRTVCTQFVAD